jgi:hypothetical protein
MSYVELCVMPTFQTSTYLDNPTLIKKKFSINLDASLPQIGWSRIGVGTEVCNFGDPFGLASHSLIGKASMGLQTRFMGETLYCMTSQHTKSTKNLKSCISVCLTEVSRPSFKQPTTQDFKLGMSLINYKINDCSYKIMKGIIKFAKI